MTETESLTRMRLKAAKAGREALYAINRAISAFEDAGWSTVALRQVRDDLAEELGID